MFTLEVLDLLMMRLADAGAQSFGVPAVVCGVRHANIDVVLCHMFLFLSLSLSLSVSLSPCLSVSLSLCKPCLSVTLSLCLSVCLSPSL